MVFRMVGIPWWQVNTHVHVVLASRLGNFFEKVTLTIFPWASRYSMIRILRRVSNESVVVFNNHNGSFEARFLQSANPLISIQVGWIEVSRVFFPISPFRIGIGVHSVVDESCQFFLVVIELGLAWKWSMIANFGFFIFWMSDWWSRSRWISRISDWLVFKDDLIHPFLLDSCFQASLDWTVASNVFCMEGVDKGNVILLAVIVINCRFR